jgi:hypothetical protein
MQLTQAGIDVQISVNAGKRFWIDRHGQRFMVMIEKAEPGDRSLADFARAVVESYVHAVADAGSAARLVGGSRDSRRCARGHRSASSPNKPSGLRILAEAGSGRQQILRLSKKAPG